MRFNKNVRYLFKDEQQERQIADACAQVFEVARQSEIRLQFQGNDSSEKEVVVFIRLDDLCEE